jgi:hypothetical protein
MIPRPLPTQYVIVHGQLSWADALWGVEQGWLEPAALIELATKRVSNDVRASKREIELAGLLSHESVEAIQLARQLASKEATKGCLWVPEQQWLYLVLRWIYENRASLSDPLGDVEEIYADFNYPAEMQHFVRYMPVTNSYDPEKHSARENETRLMLLWLEYLRTKAKELGVDLLSSTGA